MIEISNISSEQEHRCVTLIVGAGIALGALFYGLIWSSSGLGINLVLVQAAFIAMVYGLSRYTKHPVATIAWVPAAFSLAFAGAFALFASPLALVVAMIGFLVSQAVFVLYAIGHHGDFHHPFTFVHSAFFMTPLHALSRVNILRSVPLPRAVPSNARAIIVGLCVLVPVLLVFGTLFASADPLFGDYFERLVDLKSIPSGVRHLIGVAFWSLAFAAVLGLAFWKRQAFTAHLRPDARYHTESMVVLGGVVALFAVFIAVQATYLFGGEAAFHASEYTFSEYARRGFNELVAVATIVLFLFLSLRYFHGDRARGVLRVLHSVLFAETLLVLFSAVIRMNLYVEAYGYTTARLFTYWFLAAVAALLILAFVHVLRDTVQTRFMRQGMVLIGLFALGFIFSVPEAMAFRLNTERIIGEGTINVRDVISSSADAYPTLVYLDERGVALGEADAADEINMRLLPKSMYPSPDWRAWNWSKARVGSTEPFPWIGCQTMECELNVK